MKLTIKFIQFQAFETAQTAMIQLQCFIFVCAIIFNYLFIKMQTNAIKYVTIVTYKTNLYGQDYLKLNVLHWVILLFG